MTKMRASGGIRKRLSVPLKAANRPIMNEPETLTIKVPHGNHSPENRATVSEHQYRAMPPSALPIATQR
jgi:hypothetical protein